MQEAAERGVWKGSFRLGGAAYLGKTSALCAGADQVIDFCVVDLDVRAIHLVLNLTMMTFGSKPPCTRKAAS